MLYEVITIDDRQPLDGGLRESPEVDAVFLYASTSLYYFTGLKCRPSERLHGAILRQSGEPIYDCPAFEEMKTRAEIVLAGDFLLWEEHESPTRAVVDRNNFV